MASKESIYDISNRANVIHKVASGNDVVIYEDHRIIINVIFHLMDKRPGLNALDLVMFDNHDDFCSPSPKTVEMLMNFLDHPSKEELHRIVEFYLNPLDDDWVKVGMELGIIDNVFLFNSNETSVRYREEYETKRFGEKYLYNMGNVWSALGYRGILNDPIKLEHGSVCDAFGWELTDGKYRFKEDRKKFIFDIDLDCFSISILDKTIAIPEELIIPKLINYTSHGYHFYHNAQVFMKDLINRSEIVTMCFENNCCGGIRQAHKIFNMVDDLLFDNELGD